jgi:hypothetical protein
VTCGFVSPPQQAKDTGRAGDKDCRLKILLCLAFAIVAMEEREMIIAVGIDVHKERSSAYAVYTGTGIENEKHRKLLNSFNDEFSDFPSTVKQIERIAAFVRYNPCARCHQRKKQ